MKNIWYSVIIFLLISCQANDSRKNEVIINDTTMTETEMEFKIDSIDQFHLKLKEGEFVFKENDYIYFEDLHSDFGILITDHEYDDIDDTVYELFYKKERKIYRTSNIKKLEERLYKLPKGSILDWYDTCTFSRMMGLSAEKKQAFIELCNKLELNLVLPSIEDSRNIVCYCNKLN
jgi:hypothetical protein